MASQGVGRCGANNRNGIVKAHNILWLENGKRTQKTNTEPEEEKSRFIVSVSVLAAALLIKIYLPHLHHLIWFYYREMFFSTIRTFDIEISLLISASSIMLQDFMSSVPKYFTSQIKLHTRIEKEKFQRHKRHQSEDEEEEW
jgi:hypothetical protein